MLTTPGRTREGTHHHRALILPSSSSLSAFSCYSDDDGTQ